MAYSVHNFEQGDILYADQLNEMDAQIALNEQNINSGISSDMLAEDYSANKTYSIGDYVMYNNELYRCIYEITAAEGWNSAHWQKANLGDGISDLNNALNAIDGVVFERGAMISIPSSQTANSYYLDGTGKCVNRSGYKLLKYEVTAGDVIWIYATKDSDGVYQFQSAASVPSSLPNANLIGTPSTTATNGPITVPENATWIIISAESSNTVSGLYNYTTIADNIGKLEAEVFPEIDPEWVYGTASTSTGQVDGSTTNIRTKQIICKSGSKIYADDGYRVIVMKYNAITGAYIGSYGSWASSYTVDGTYSVLVLAKYSNTATIANVSDVSSHIHLDLVADGQVTENAKQIEYMPFTAQVPPLFEGGITYVTGQIYHDANETWAKSRVRTNVMRIHEGAKLIKKNGNYNITICRYADYNLKNYIETVVSDAAVVSWVCQETGYYTITFRLSTSATLSILEVKEDWDFSAFYAIRDERIHINWIGSGNLEETSTAADVGDCAMVVFPDGDGILIDSGNKRNYTSLRKRIVESGFFHIPKIIISHFHSDHIGGLIQMVASGYVDIAGSTIYLPDYDATLWAYNNNVMEDTTKALYDEAMTMFTDNNCVLVYPDIDFKPYEIGGAVISFFNTDLSVYENVSTNYNDWSLCNYIFYGDMNVCFTGDIGPIAQGNLAGSLYKSNVYKADHHGWLNQTTIPAGYIENVSPDVIIAMDGSTHDDLYQGDRAPLVQWAMDNCVPFYRKYQNNEIKMAVSKNGWLFESKTKRYYKPTT